METLTTTNQHRISNTRLLGVNACILVVEDELEILQVVEGYLRRDGFRTERATDGTRALPLQAIPCDARYAW